MSPLSNILTLTEKYGNGNHTNHCKPYLQEREAVSLSQYGDIHMSPLSNILTLTEKYGNGNHTNHCTPYLQEREAVSLSQYVTLSCVIHTRVENS